MVCTTLATRQQGAAQQRPPPRGDRQRQADAEPEGERRDAHQHVAAEVVGQPREGVGEAGVDGHRGDDGMRGAGRETAIYRGFGSSH